MEQVCFVIDYRPPLGLLFCLRCVEYLQGLLQNAPDFGFEEAEF